MLPSNIMFVYESASRCTSSSSYIRICNYVIYIRENVKTSDYTNIPSSANSLPCPPTIFPSAVFSSSLGYQSRVSSPQSDPQKQPVQQRKKKKIAINNHATSTQSLPGFCQDTTTIYSEQPLDNYGTQCFRLIFRERKIT